MLCCSDADGSMVLRLLCVVMSLCSILWESTVLRLHCLSTVTCSFAWGGMVLWLLWVSIVLCWIMVFWLLFRGDMAMGAMADKFEKGTVGTLEEDEDVGRVGMVLGTMGDMHEKVSGAVLEDDRVGRRVRSFGRKTGMEEVWGRRWEVDCRDQGWMRGQCAYTEEDCVFVGEFVVMLRGNETGGTAVWNDSIKDTWKELKMWLVDWSQRWYAFESGAYPISVHGMEQWCIFGLLVGMSTNMQQPISQRWERDSLQLCQSS